MKVDELREKYLCFYESKGHVRRASDVLVPTWDPSVLFTPAGMNQFKDHFLGKVKLEFTRATTCQKCLRTGDIENVGRTAYHHTFFEMLGDFSFGDYFKEESIRWAWEFLTDKRWLGLDPQRLSVSVYVDDAEAAKIWSEGIGVPPEKIQRLGEDENFWPANAPSQGPDGVCGPCSEIFYHLDQANAVEIWNLVFTQFNRVGDPPDNLRPLPSKNIDTGMGLERTASLLQGVDTNYHIDTLLPIVEATAEVCSIKYEPDCDLGRRLRRITDHVRACTFAIHENVYPGPNKEKYIVKRLLRRAVLDGHQLGMREPFLHQLVGVVAEMMKIPYPELCQTIDRVAGVIEKEEGNFFGTIDAGLERIERIFAEMQGEDRVIVNGGEAAELYQTYGIPPDLFETMAAERNVTFDWDGFARAMQEHGVVSGKQQFKLFKTGPVEAIKRAIHLTEFLGYETTEATAHIKAIIAQDKLCDQVTKVGDQQPIVVVLDRSPFYGEAGGQVGDTGQIVGAGFAFQVNDTQRDGDLILHHGHLTDGELTTGAKVTARVDSARRQAVRRAHSATHLLHYALQKNLGGHAQQQGSKVDDDWLRFDFTHLAALGEDHLVAIEKDVAVKVTGAETVGWTILPLSEARQAGAMMLFGEKYPDPVRMVLMGQFSRELCGGTHLDRTSDVGSFEIIGEEAVSAGTRRITALTGPKAEQHIERTKNALTEAAEVLGVEPGEVPAAAKAWAQNVRELKKHLSSGGKLPEAVPMRAKPPLAESLDRVQAKTALRHAARTLNVSLFDVPARAVALKAEAEDIRHQIDQREQAGGLSSKDLLKDADEVNGSKVVVANVEGADANLMRRLIDQLRKTAGPCAVMLATRQGDEKVLLVAGISRELVARGANAGNWVRATAKLVGGGGGGKPDMAQAGGRYPEKLPEALRQARTFIREML